MGCTHPNGQHPATLEDVPAITSANSTKPVQPMASPDQPLSEQEIEQRIESSVTTRTLSIAEIDLRYAWVSQRGYYPEALDKDNQDAYVFIPDFGGNNEQLFLGIFDGHGKDGHHCARFARDHLARNILDKLDRITSSNPTQVAIKHAIKVAHHVTNDAIHNAPDFDDSLSGTTAISILFQKRKMFINNVGDSRAIIVTATTDGRLIAQPLSSDQTPYRKDERERVKKFGARILSMDQIEGLEPVHENWGDLTLGDEIDEGGDPPRIWSPLGDYPGTAFTRSLGDLFAEECGVIPEPEILVRDLRPEDKFVIIASDGVFEFLTNQMVAEILIKQSDPLEACKAVVATAYNMWLQYEVRTDDITIIALYVDNVGRGNMYTASSSFYNPEDIHEIAVNDPAIENTKIEEIQGSLDLQGSFGASLDETNENGLSNHNMSNNNLFSGASSKKFPTESTGLTVIEVPPAIGENNPRPVRRVVSREKRKYMIQLKHENSAIFGQESLNLGQMEETPETIPEPKSEEDFNIITKSLKSNFLFQHLTTSQRAAVIGAMKKVLVKEGNFVIRQFLEGESFYIISNGKLEVRVKNLNPHPEPNKKTSFPQKHDESFKETKFNEKPDSTEIIQKLTKADNVIGMTEGEKEALAGPVVYVYEGSGDQHPGFGELSLMYGKPRAASVIALSDSELWALDRRVFRRLVLKTSNLRRDIIKTLQKVELFHCLNTTQLQRLTDLLSEATFTAGDTIIHQGDPSESFFLIVSGRCQCVVDQSKTQRKPTSDLLIDPNTPETPVGDLPSVSTDLSPMSKAVQDSETTPPPVPEDTENSEGAKKDSPGEEEVNPFTALVVAEEKEKEKRDETTPAESTSEDLPAVPVSGPRVVMELDPYDFFGEKALLESKPRVASVIAVTDTKLLYIGKTGFEEVLGPLKMIIDQHRLTKEAIAAREMAGPHSLSELELQGVSISDNLGFLLLGKFKSAEVNTTVRSFLLSELEKTGLSDSVLRFLEGSKSIMMSNIQSMIVPRQLSVLRDSNALHVTYDVSVVSDLSSIVRHNSEKFIDHAEFSIFTFSCLFCALEILHEKVGIIYRAVQPESLYVDAAGRLILLDYSVCKVGMNNGSNNNNDRTYTVCGASDYLAPEQISQVGHSYPVDLWGAGVLLYELAVGSHPFSSSSEVSTYAKISSFGSKAFPSLKFPDYVSPETKSLINSLLMPIPEARIGTGGGAHGFAALKKHKFFRNFSDWDHIQSGSFPSPLKELAEKELEDLVEEGVNEEIIANFNKNFEKNGVNVKWLEKVDSFLHTDSDQN